MDELFYDGFWLETTDGSNFWNPSPITLTDLNPTSSYFPTSEATIGLVNTNNPHHDSFLTETAISSTFGEPALSYLEMDDFSENVVVEEAQVNRRLWVGPNRINPISVKKRLVQAINGLNDSIRDKDVLIQIWVPVKRGSRQVLTTNNQPFSLNPNCKNLAEYRDVSQNYQFAADEDSKEFVGLPGRVFLNKLPEWTPDVRFFKRDEYQRVSHAQQYDVRGSLALPVFEQGSGVCLGVVEIVTTSHNVNFSPELENICKALEAVDLKSSNIQNPNSVEDRNESYQGALTEIRAILKFVCETHKLPLAQAWALCVQQQKGGCRHSDENYASCVSIIDSACYVADAQVSGFHEACSEHHLFKDEGVVGKAFLTNQPCFRENITTFTITEYPLAHFARVFNLCAAGAIRMRSTYNNGADDFVLEFFLPLNGKDAEDQMLLLNSLSSFIQQNCRSLRVVTDQELARETSATERGTLAGNLDDEKHKGKAVAVSLTNHEAATLEHEKPEQNLVVNRSHEGSGNFSLTIGDTSLGAKTSSEKRRTKTERTISLRELRQHFSGSLKEAAKSIGVCPTTLKRICRQHGITRWPSRKIKKVSHSLRKLQLVIDSVQGAEGSIQLSSFYNNYPNLVSPKNLVSPNQPDGNNLLSPATTPSKSPPSSGSHSSTSSLSCSTAAKQSSSIPISGSIFGDALSAEKNGVVMLKRAQSDAELHEKGQEETKLLMRSYSHKIFSEAPAVLTFRVKVAFREEMIRFSLQPQWGFRDLQEEVLRRFNINDGSSVSLKYLDDDAEWVLLTCDADLEECTYIHRSSKNPIIKLALSQASHRNLGSSFGSNGH